MRNGWWKLMVCIAALLWASPSSGLDGYDPDSRTPDAIQIELVDNTLVAVRRSVPLEPFELTLDEQVLTTQSRGAVGAAITSERFLLISDTSEGWLEGDFNLNEGYSARMVLSENMIVLSTLERVVGFDGSGNRLEEYALGAGEHIIEQAAGPDVLVFATEYRAGGLAAGGLWTIQDFEVSEIFRSLNAGAKQATVQTSDRLMTFSADGGNWSMP